MADSKMIRWCYREDRTEYMTDHWDFLAPSDASDTDLEEVRGAAMADAGWVPRYTRQHDGEMTDYDGPYPCDPADVALLPEAEQDHHHRFMATIPRIGGRKDVLPQWTDWERERHQGYVPDGDGDA